MKKFATKFLLWGFTCIYVLIYILFFLFLFVVLILVWIAGIFSKKLQHKLINSTAYIWAKVTLWLTGSRISVISPEHISHHMQNVVYISNHQSLFDIPLLLGWIDSRIRFMAKDSLFRIPILGQWMKTMGCIPVSRKVSRSELKKFDTVATYLCDGGIVSIFPEGTRTRDGTLQKFHLSAFRPAQQANSTIVPVFIQGSWDILPPGKRTISPARVIIIIGEPIYYHQYSKWNRKQLSEYVREKIEQLPDHLNDS